MNKGFIDEPGVRDIYSKDGRQPINGWFQCPAKGIYYFEYENHNEKMVLEKGERVLLKKCYGGYRVG